MKNSFHLLRKSHVWTCYLSWCAQLSLWLPFTIILGNSFHFLYLVSSSLLGFFSVKDRGVLSFFLSTTGFCSISRNCFNNGRETGKRRRDARHTSLLRRQGNDGSERTLWIDRRPKNEQSYGWEHGRKRETQLASRSCAPKHRMRNQKYTVHFGHLWLYSLLILGCSVGQTSLRMLK